MSLEWIRKYYGVPARRGGRVEYTGGGGNELGTIFGTSGPHLRIRLDGKKHSTPFHPTWELRYLEAAAVAAASIEAASAAR